VIFVTVGTHDEGFHRLVKAMDELTTSLDEKVMIQYGATEYDCKNASSFQFCSYEEMVKYIEQSDCVVCHGGAGTILDCLRLEKPVIVVPRQKQYGEVIDDHEFELASALSNREDVLLVREISKLETTISQLDIAEIEESIGTSADLSRYLSKYLNELSRSGGL